MPETYRLTDMYYQRQIDDLLETVHKQQALIDQYSVLVKALQAQRDELIGALKATLALVGKYAADK